MRRGRGIGFRGVGGRRRWRASLSGPAPTSRPRHLPPAAAGVHTERAKEAETPPRNCRYSRDLGVVQLTVLLVTLGYAGG